MEVLSIENINLEEVANLLDTGAPRDLSAWHVSNLLESAQHIVKGNTVYYEGDGEPTGIMSMGRLWEIIMDAYLACYAEERGWSYTPNVYLERDGVVASLDGLMIMQDKAAVVETKLRFTLNDDILFRHQQQIKAYCYMLNTDYAIYPTMHISSAPPTARLLIRHLRFTWQSILENWQMLTNTKSHLESLGLGPTQ